MSLSKLTLTMASTITAIPVLPSTHVPGASEDQRKIQIPGYGFAQTSITEDSTPPARQILVKEVTLGGSATQIDLTSAPIIGADDGSGAPNADEDISGLRLFLIQWFASAANAAVIELKGDGVTNGYPTFGASGIVKAAAGEYGQIYRTVASGLQAIDATHKIIEIDGTSGDSVNLLLGFTD